MGSKITFRHNMMAIKSIETFISIRGGFNNGLRDVYFVRGIGEPLNLTELINDIDKKMGMEMANNRLKYIRINSLPKIMDENDSSYYSNIYDQWKKGEPFTLKSIPINSSLEGVLCEAYKSVIERYVESKATVTDSMIRNFATKIMYWLDVATRDSLSGWSERGCVKVIADNIIKEQEYLFFYFLTLLGCDVLLIENKSDVTVSDSLKNLSIALPLGKFGNASLGVYEPYVPQKANGKQLKEKKSSEDIHNQQNRITIPKRPDRHNTTAPNSNVQRSVVNSSQIIVPQSQNQEKTFEELAMLASSIVLIEIHDQEGDIIGTGSGIMIGRGGYILTNNHVAAGGCFFTVRVEDDEEDYATDEIIKYNSNTDLAVIRIRKQLNPLPIYRGSKKLVRGQKVVAIGSPLGLFNSVSDGIISGFRNIDDVDMIQFTAPISHGSSGGAVLNMQGEVIGISTAGFDSGQNINLAIGYESILLFASGFLN
ncbi:MAG: trypsin-like peptidase domain-containing protein [Lachnospiraceae bacterium]|nr:trypsin-like peptidase domain-containing protein [Lachnospiraceae bacterium]